MTRRIIRSVVLAAVLIGFNYPALASLQIGDIAFIGFNADGDDDFAVVALKDITSQTIFFTDNEPNGGIGLTDSNEGALEWNSGVETISAGTVIVFSNASAAARSASVGSFSMPDSTFNLAAGGDGLWAFQGTNATTPTIFLAAVANDDFGNTDVGSLTGTNLTEGSTAVEFSTSTADGGAYIGPRSGKTSFDQYLAEIGNPANWTTNSSDGEQLLDFDTTAFTITSAVIPEPASLLVWGGVGLLGVGLAIYRKKVA